MEPGDEIKRSGGLGKRSLAILNILLPPVIAVVPYGVVFWLRSPPESSRLGDALLAIIAILPLSYVFATLPTILHAIGMERVYRKAPPSTWKALACSTLSGGIAGILIAAIPGGMSLLNAGQPDWLTLFRFCFIWGAATGFATSALIFALDWATRKRAKS